MVARAAVSRSEIIIIYLCIHLDVKGVFLDEVFLVAGIFETDASPSGAQQSRLLSVVTGALHAQIRMVI